MGKRNASTIIMKLTKYLFLLFTVCFTYTSYAGDIDSLKYQLQVVTTDSGYVDLLNDISWAYNRTDLDSTRRYAKDALERGKAINYRAGISRAYNLIAIVEVSNGNDSKALFYNIKSLRLAESINNQFLIGAATNDLGVLNSYKGDFKTALKYYQRSLKASRFNNDILGINFTLNNIGMIHEDLGNIDKAMEYYQEATTIGLKSKDPGVLASCYSNMGRVYEKKGDFDKALELEQKALDIALKANDKWSLSYSYMNIGYYQNEKGMTELAEASYQKAIKTADDFGDKTIIGACRMELAIINNKQKKYSEAIMNGEIAQAVFKELDNADSTNLQLNNVLATAYAGKGNYKKAFELLQSYNKLQDSVLSKDNRRMIAELETSFKTQEKDTENKWLKTKEEKNGRLVMQQKIIIIISIILIILMGFLVFFINRSSQSKKQNIAQLEEKVLERTQTLKTTNAALERFNYIASHDLKEPIRSIASFTQLLERETDSTNKNAEIYLGFIKRSTNRMYKLVNAMLEVSRYKKIKPNFQSVEIHKIIDNIKEDLSTYILERNAIVEHTYLPTAKADTSLIRIVFQNLIKNGLKYNESTIPFIKIYAEETETEDIFCFSDNGIGIKEEFQSQIFEAFRRLYHYDKYTGTGIGLFISKDIVALHNGRIWIEENPNGGSIFKVALPK